METKKYSEVKADNQLGPSRLGNAENQPLQLLKFNESTPEKEAVVRGKIVKILPHKKAYRASMEVSKPQQMETNCEDVKANKNEDEPKILSPSLKETQAKRETSGGSLFTLSPLVPVCNQYRRPVVIDGYNVCLK